MLAPTRKKTGNSPVATKKTKKVKYAQGMFVPTNFKKYKGTVPIIYRSSWERILMSYLDLAPNIVEWGSESFIVEYKSPLDGRLHRYFLDINLVAKNTMGVLKKYILEIKPEYKLYPPKTGSKKAEAEFAVNMAKWKYAEIMAHKRGYTFLIITEKNIKAFMERVNRGVL